MYSIHNISLFKEYKEKLITDYEILKRKLLACRELNMKIVLTIGSWDVLHVGHNRYLLEAKKLGDILVVGADSDRLMKLYKGEHRPLTEEAIRLEMLSYQAFIDFITIIDDCDDEGNWQLKLIKTVPVDLFVAVEGDSYTEGQLAEIKKYCGELKLIPRQAEHVSTTMFIQKVLKQHPMIKDLATLIEKYT